MPNEIPLVFHNGSNYSYHFIVKGLSDKFEDQVECLWESTEKYKTFFIPIEKEVTKIDKDGNRSVATPSYKTKFVDGARFTTTSLSNFVDKRRWWFFFWIWKCQGQLK